MYHYPYYSAHSGDGILHRFQQNKVILIQKKFNLHFCLITVWLKNQCCGSRMFPTFQLVSDPFPDPASHPSWIFIFKLSILVEKLSNFVSLQSSFTSNLFRIRSCPDPEWLIPDPDPAKSFGSDRIWIYNTVKNNYESCHVSIRMCLSNKKLTLTKTNSEIPNDLCLTEINNFSLVAQS